MIVSFSKLIIGKFSYHDHKIKFLNLYSLRPNPGAMLTLLKEHHIKIPEEWGVPKESGRGWEGTWPGGVPSL